jgi:hypothetical protein
MFWSLGLQIEHKTYNNFKMSVRMLILRNENPNYTMEHLIPQCSCFKHAFCRYAALFGTFIYLKSGQEREGEGKGKEKPRKEDTMNPIKKKMR